jgi:MFS superfamily sulfate permease-like transporter
MGFHMMDVSQIARASVSTSVAKIVAGKQEPHHPNCDRRVVIFALRGAVRFAGSERLTRAIVRELGEPDPKDPGSGEYQDACAIVVSLKDAFSLNMVARRVIHESIKRLLAEGKTVVVIDPNVVLQMDLDKLPMEQHPQIVKNEKEAREFIGGAGCSAITQSDNW